jgi:threonine synthase
MPADVAAVNRAEVLACRARLVLVDGLVDDCGRLSAMLAQRTGAFDVRTLKEPCRVGGRRRSVSSLPKTSSGNCPT